MSLEDLSPEAKDELASLARDLANDPSTRKDFLRLMKKKRPDVPVPELEVEERTNAAVQAATGEVEKLKNQLRERDALTDLDKRRQALKEKGLAKTDEEIAEVEKIMLDKGITQHEAAAEYRNWMKQAATPTPTRYNSAFLDKTARDTLGKYHKNPIGAAREEAANALHDIRTGRVNAG